MQGHSPERGIRGAGPEMTVTTLHKNTRPSPHRAISLRSPGKMAVTLQPPALHVQDSRLRGRHQGNINISWAAPSWPPTVFSIVMKQFRISNSGLMGCRQHSAGAGWGNYFKSFQQSCSPHRFAELSVCDSGHALLDPQCPVSPHSSRHLEGSQGTSL